MRGLPARSGGGFQTRPHHGVTMVLLRCPGRAGFQPAGELHWLCGLPAHSGGGFQTRPHHGATEVPWACGLPARR